MGDFVLMSARQNLVHAERLGDTERAKRIKARIAELEAAQPEPEEAPEALPEALPEPEPPKPAAKPAAKKKS
jgi:hypothetical protein